MTTIMKRYQFPPGMAAQVLKSLFVHATPGQWDARASWVVASVPPTPGVQMGVESQDNHDYYGGQLVAESCSGADAALIAAMIAMLPSVCDAYTDAVRELERATMQLRLVEGENEELEKFIELIRSERYQRPAFWVARRLELDELRRRELAGPSGLTPDEHRARHVMLHRFFDELLADFLCHNDDSLPGSTTLLDLMKWSHGQTIDPQEPRR